MGTALDPAILIVDDDELVRELLDRWLVAGGYRTLKAADAESAVTILSESPVAVALCDRAKPGLGGNWLVAQIQERFPLVGVIIATGGDIRPSIAGQHGILGYLQKPFDSATVLSTVAEAMEWHKAAAALDSRDGHDLQADCAAAADGGNAGSPDTGGAAR